MKKSVLGIVAVLLALGFILAGCTGPIGSYDIDSAPVRNMGNGFDVPGFYPGQEFKLALDEKSGRKVFSGNDTNGPLVVTLKLTATDKDGPVAYTFCSDVALDVYDGSTYKLVDVLDYFKSGDAEKLMAAITYIANNYGDMEDSDLVGYYQIVQSVLWNIVNNKKINRVDNSDNKARIEEAINYVTGHIDDLVGVYNAYKAGVSMEGSAGEGPGTYGPFNVSENPLLADVLFNLTFEEGSGKFVDADGIEITQVKPGDEFYVQVTTSGKYKFTATAKPGLQYVSDFLFFVDKNRPITSSQPLFLPVLSPWVFSCGACFKIDPPPVYKGDIKIEKTVNGINIAAWVSANKAEYQFTNINDLISFNLYKVAGDGAPVAGAPYANVKLNAAGFISFTGLDDGWYAVEEVLTAAGAKVFEAPAGVKYILLANGLQYGESNEFDYSAEYEIANGYGGGYVLGYPGLNDTGDIFPIGVTLDGEYFASFCGNAGSVAFAPDGYMVAVKMDRGAAAYADFVKAYNYIENKYGNLAENRPITQILTWYVLGAINYPSAEFDAIDWAAVEAGGSVVAGVADAKAKVEDVIKNFKNYQGDAKIVDIVYMVGKNYVDDYINGQPQYVPIYSGKSEFTNTALPPPPPVKVLGPSYGTVTATNMGNVPAILKGLNPKNGNPLYDKKAPEDPNKSTPFVVPNANHFVFAKMTRAELEAGVALEFLVGNKYEVVGTGFVQLVGGNIVLTIDNFAKGEFGLIAFNQLPEFNNGNIHSQKEADLKKLGATTGFNHDNKAVIPCPTGNTIYLYFHAGTLQFYL